MEELESNGRQALWEEQPQEATPSLKLKGPGVKATQKSHYMVGAEVGAEVARAMRRPREGWGNWAGSSSLQRPPVANPGTARTGTRALTLYVPDTVLNS